MQSSSLLESRRIAWQFCSTSRCNSVPQHQPSTQLTNRLKRAGLPITHWKGVVGSPRQALCPRVGLHCKAQISETKERQSKNSSSNGRSPNGVHSNGSRLSDSSSNGPAPGNGNGASHGAHTAKQQNLGSYDKHERGQKSAEKGTLDKLLETSRQVGFISGYCSTAYCLESVIVPLYLHLRLRTAVDIPADLLLSSQPRPPRANKLQHCLLDVSP